jgi:hypothetical protein
MNDWRKSSYSGADNNCVEVRRDLNAVRDSKNPGPMLRIERDSWLRFLGTVRQGR